MNLKKISVTIFLLAACYGSVRAGRYFLPKYAPVKIEAKYRARSQGNPKAPLWIVEYLDFQCGVCRQAHQVLNESLKALPDDLYLQIRYYPLIHNHLYALKSALYAECAARQGRFREFSDALFQTQGQWAASKDPDTIFTGLAAQNGLDLLKLKACVEDPGVKEEILAERQEGKSLGIRQTPTFFVNGKKIEGLDPIVIELQNYLAEKKARTR